VRGQEISFDRLRHGRVIQVRLPAIVAGRPKNLVHNVPRVALAQLLLQRSADEIDQIRGNAGVKGDLMLVGDPAEDLAKLPIGDRANLDLGLNPAQETGVDQFGRVHVGREDDQHLEGDLNLFSARQGEEIDSAIKGHDPAVQQFFRTNPLPSEVVDDQNPIVGLHLRRGDIDTS
jgi:hypothetical protein